MQVIIFTQIWWFRDEKNSFFGAHRSICGGMHFAWFIGFMIIDVFFEQSVVSSPDKCKLFKDGDCNTLRTLICLNSMWLLYRLFVLAVFQITLTGK